MEREKISKDQNWAIKGYRCNECKMNFGILYFNDVSHCPYCGSRNIIYGSSVYSARLDSDLYFEPEQKTPAQIVEEIGRLYHSSSKYRIIDGESTIHRNENEMERLLNELKEMAEK